MANKRFQVALCDEDGLVIFDTPNPVASSFNTLAEACKQACLTVGYQVRADQNSSGFTSTKVPVKYAMFFDSETNKLRSIDVTLDNYGVCFYTLTNTTQVLLLHKKNSTLQLKNFPTFAEAMGYVANSKTGFIYPHGINGAAVELPIHRVLIESASPDTILALMTDAWSAGVSPRGF